MPRTLPWKTEAIKKKQSPRSATTTPKRRREHAPDDVINSDLEDLDGPTPARRTIRRHSRTPSTSPPPALPDIEYMQEGVEHDDAFRMVEDEFVITAKLFTQHIHFAEYVRLKKLARSRGKDALAAMRRGTDGRTEKSVAVQLREEAEEMARQRDGDQDSEEDDEYLLDPQLAGLMAGEQLCKADGPGRLPSMRPELPRRSTMGSSPPPMYDDDLDLIRREDKDAIIEVASPQLDMNDDEDKTDDDDDDDLNVTTRLPAIHPTVSTPVSKIRSNHTPGMNGSSTIRKSSSVTRGHHISDDRSNAKAGHRSSGVDTGYTPPHRPRLKSPTLQEAFPRSPRTTNSPSENAKVASNAAVYIAQKRAAREKREEDERRKTTRATQIPTFIL